MSELRCRARLCGSTNIKPSGLSGEAVCEDCGTLADDVGSLLVFRQLDEDGSTYHAGTQRLGQDGRTPIGGAPRGGGNFKQSQINKETREVGRLSPFEPLACALLHLCAARQQKLTTRPSTYRGRSRACSRRSAATFRRPTSLSTGRCIFTSTCPKISRRPSVRPSSSQPPPLPSA